MVLAAVLSLLASLAGLWLPAARHAAPVPSSQSA